MKKFGVCVFISICLVSLLSCSMFTASLGNPRDLSKAFEDASVQEIVDLLNSKQVLSKEDAKGIAGALAKKDPVELKNLSTKDKGTIVNTVVSGVLPSPDELLGIMDSETITGMDTSQTENFMNAILHEGFLLVDTNVSLEVLEHYFNDADVVKSLIREEAAALLMGIFGLTAFLTKEGGADLKAEDSFFSLFEETLTQLGNVAYTGKNDSVTTEEKQKLDETLTSDLQALYSSKKVSALVNTIVVLYIFRDQEGLSSLGGLESLFDGLLGAEV